MTGESVLDFGVIMLACVTGQRAISGKLTPRLQTSMLARHVAALVLGVALLTPLLVFLAAIGELRMPWLGAIGWIGAATMAARSTIGALRSRNARSPIADFDLYETLICVVAACFVWFAASGRDETLLSGRDQQVYAEAAVALSTRATAASYYTPLDVADRALLREISGTQIPDVTDNRAGVDTPIRLRHPTGWPVWLAVAQATFGMDGLYAANSVVFAIGGLVFFVLLRCIVPSLLAVAATSLLYALPCSLWIAGISLSEPLAMTLLLGLPLFADAGLERSRVPMALILAATTLVRIDTVLVLPALIVAALLAATAMPDIDSVRRTWRFIRDQLLAFAFALLCYWTMFPDYLALNAGRVILGGVFSIALAAVGLALLRIEGGRHLRNLAESTTTRAGVIVILAILVCYAAAFRPSLQPFSIIASPSPLAGTRDFREDSLLNLAAYVSWPIVLASVVGACYAVWQRWLTRGAFLSPLILAIGLGPTLFYLWFPEVSPDHPWAFRRFMLTSVPYTLLFAAVAVHALFHRWGAAGRAIGAAALVAAYPLTVWAIPPGRILMREHDGLTATLQTLGHSLPESLVVADGISENIAASLLIAFGKPVVYVNRDLEEPSDQTAVKRWIKAKQDLGRTAWILRGPHAKLAGIALRPQQEWRLASTYIARAVRAPATNIAAETSRIELVQATIPPDSLELASEKPCRADVSAVPASGVQVASSQECAGRKQ